MTGPGPKPLRDNEAAELELVKLIEEWQEEWHLEDYEVTDILRRRLHYLYVKRLNEARVQP